MNCRRHGTKPTVALWLLVVIADTMLIVTKIGVMSVLLALAAVATVAVAVAGVWSLRRGVHEEGPVPAVVPVRSRRRA